MQYKHKSIRISALSYLNTYPFVFAINEKLASKIGEIKFEVPAVSAQKFKNKEVDVALVPVGALPELVDYEIITDFCIGSKGKVKTVSLYSKVPINKIQCIYLDSESRTSVNLVKILAKNFWKISPKWQIYTTAMNPLDCESVLLIGDKTFPLNDKFPFVIDLSEEWLKFANLPFTFAVWVKQKGIDKSLEEDLNKIFQFGIDNIAQLFDKFDVNISREEFENYLINNIDYTFDNPKKVAIEKYLTLLSNL
ncbi:MAG: hypothetical protein AUJ98_07175 [Bacteroidetes bacterium CG2_30_33_31]|nr:MAG: hypothetical protein AUJ98_07175 [Bacteroidetes bacterium CG2_30_33_31]